MATSTVMVGGAAYVLLANGPGKWNVQHSVTYRLYLVKAATLPDPDAVGISIAGNAIYPMDVPTGETLYARFYGARDGETFPVVIDSVE